MTYFINKIFGQPQDRYKKLCERVRLNLKFSIQSHTEKRPISIL
jgi:hypothetical protein